MSARPACSGPRQDSQSGWRSLDMMYLVCQAGHKQMFVPCCFIAEEKWEASDRSHPNLYSTTSLKYHLLAKHVFANTDANTETSSSRARQATLAECSRAGSVNKTTTNKLTNAIAKWVATDCRPINIVEDKGLRDIIQIASGDSSYKTPSKGTIVTRIHELYGSEKERKVEQLARASFIALTGDHWTSVSNHN
ncbi:unnamed protein product [Pleuronectes platessa]|uniref:Transposase n=1 Tax=Pleuronectes platessa TaxID=8262 RepID=A0A9N7YLJ5_PLEPL|nr:unnamed protein product [Pleuronectes platessa]